MKTQTNNGIEKHKAKKQKKTKTKNQTKKPMK
jgi:hypothetical protein